MKYPLSSLLFCLFFGSLSFAETEPNNLSTTANSLSIGDTTGNLAASVNDIDWYTLRLSADSSLSIEINTDASPRQRRGEVEVALIRLSDGYLMGSYQMRQSGSAITFTVAIDRSDDYLLSISNSSVLTESLPYEIRTAIESPSRPNAGGSLSGLWQVGDQGYASIHDNGESIEVVVLGYSDTAGYRWESMSGIKRENTAKLKTDIGYVSMEIDALFPTPTSAEFTVLSCTTIIAGNPCRFRPGITFFLEKL